MHTEPGFTGVYLDEIKEQIGSVVSHARTMCGF